MHNELTRVYDSGKIANNRIYTKIRLKWKWSGRLAHLRILNKKRNIQLSARSSLSHSLFDSLAISASNLFRGTHLPRSHHHLQFYYCAVRTEEFYLAALPARSSRSISWLFWYIRQSQSIFVRTLPVERWEKISSNECSKGRFREKIELIRLIILADHWMRSHISRFWISFPFAKRELKLNIISPVEPWRFQHRQWTVIYRQTTRSCTHFLDRHYRFYKCKQKPFALVDLSEWIEWNNQLSFNVVFRSSHTRWRRLLTF